MDLTTTIRTATPTATPTSAPTPTPIVAKTIIDRKTVETIKLLDKPTDRNMFGKSNGLLTGILFLLALILIVLVLALKQEKKPTTETKKNGNK